MNLQEIGDKISESLEFASGEILAQKPRSHLGASEIGNDCSAALWYKFRWVKFPQFVPRMLRLFSRGHEEEPRIIKWLTGAGFNVSDIDPVTGKQYRLQDVSGHFGGSCDGIAEVPDWLFQRIGDRRILVEFKTASAKAFAKLVKQKVKRAKPEHWAQTCTYGFKMQLNYVLYLTVNKDNDEIYVEFLKIDHSHGESMIRKAQDVIVAKLRPNRISEDPAHFMCKFCDMKGPCHHNEPAIKNCRSCTHCEVAEDAQWLCNKFKRIIPNDYVIKGCDQWESLI